jgi:hypothetical protein
VNVTGSIGIDRWRTSTISIDWKGSRNDPERLDVTGTDEHR